MKISCVMTSYNPNPEWLQRALDSVKGLFDEFILIDNGSTVPIDGATLRLESNLGTAGGRNVGNAISTGDIICSLDDDDYWDRDNVIELKKFIKDNDADLWHFPIQLFGNQTGLWGNYDYVWDLEYANTIPCGAWYKRKVWEDLKFEGICEDWDMWARAKKRGYKFKYFSGVVYHHNMRVGSVSSDFVGNKLERIRKEIKERTERTQPL